MLPKSIGKLSHLRYLDASDTRDSRLDATIKESFTSYGGGGVGDVYGKDTATENMSITPWTIFIARKRGVDDHETFPIRYLALERSGREISFPSNERFRLIPITKVYSMLLLPKKVTTD
ncbi:hypothetical protein ACH5RR_032873 [Cinchona calisaya]|uniref:Uncharacterized protein n=1 Tax=Cinchona calisaya TaxID=153742 RepID=A0ABD2YLE3_9GENT